MFYNFAILGIG